LRHHPGLQRPSSFYFSSASSAELAAVVVVVVVVAARLAVVGIDAPVSHYPLQFENVVGCQRKEMCQSQDDHVQ